METDGAHVASGNATVPRQHRLYVAGRTIDGMAYGVYRRNTSVLRDGRMTERAKNIGTRDFRWEQPTPATPAQVTAVTALAALALIPDGESGIRLTASTEAIDLLDHFRTELNVAPIPTPAPSTLSIAHTLLQSAELRADDTLEIPFTTRIPPTLSDRLISVRRGLNARSVNSNPSPESEPIDPGSWVADFSGVNSGKVGVAAFFCPSEDRPVKIVRIPDFGKSAHGEMLAVLVAHVQARLAGVMDPVIRNDYEDLSHVLRQHESGVTDQCGSACREMLHAMGVEEFRRVQVQWVSRNNPAVKEVDSAARQARRKMTWPSITEKPWRSALAKARTLAATGHP